MCNLLYLFYNFLIRLKSTSSEMQDKISELESKNTDFESDLEAQILNNGDLQEEVERKESMLDEANDKIRDLEIQISQIQTEKDESIISLKSEVERAGIRIFELEERLETIQCEKEGLTEEISALESFKETIVKELEAKTSTFEAMKEDNLEKSETLANLEAIRYTFTFSDLSVRTACN